MVLLQPAAGHRLSECGAMPNGIVVNPRAQASQCQLSARRLATQLLFVMQEAQLHGAPCMKG